MVGMFYFLNYLMLFLGNSTIIVDLLWVFVGWMNTYETWWEHN
jgi:hypothetical protein